MSDTPAPPIQEPFAIGDVLLDRYRVEGRLTVGGHSLVYRGSDQRLSRPVCIKVFYRPKDRDGVLKTSYEHFVQEAFALSKLTHPNTLRIYDFGHLPGQDESKGRPFQVSEFVNGGTLSARIRANGPIPAAAAAIMLDGLCGALAEAHHEGIVHRDIKPQNILFMKSGARETIKLADFGIAKLTEPGHEGVGFRAGDTSATAGRTLMMLSLTWASPEQIAGDTVGPWSDIYSMALIATYMVTGRALFVCRDADQAYDRRAASDARIDAAMAGLDVPGPFIALVKRACQMDPAKRPGSVEALAGELADCLGASEIRSPARLQPLPSPPAEAGAPPEPAPQRARVNLANPPARVGDRRASFILSADGSADIQSARTRLTLSMVDAGGRVMMHIKPLSCFVAIVGKRASSAVQLAESEFVDFLLPNQQAIARARLCFGRAAAGHLVFDLGDLEVALPVSECGHAVALDFGPGAECFFVYTVAAPGRAVVSADAAQGGQS